MGDDVTTERQCQQKWEKLYSKQQAVWKKHKHSNITAKFTAQGTQIHLPTHLDQKNHNKFYEVSMYHSCSRQLQFAAKVKRAPTDLDSTAQTTMCTIA